MDVKTAFRVIEEEVYIEQPEEFDVENRETHVCRLHRALYGLKQAPRGLTVIYGRWDFSRVKLTTTCYFLTGEVPLILVLYVDDLFLTGDESLIGDCKSNLAVEFEMKDLGLMYYILGLEV